MLMHFYAVPPELEPMLQAILESVGLRAEQYHWQAATRPPMRRLIIHSLTPTQHADIWAAQERLSAHTPLP